MFACMCVAASDEFFFSSFFFFIVLSCCESFACSLLVARAIFFSFILVAHSLIHSFAHSFTRITLVRKKSFRYLLLHINTHFICVWICRANANRRALSFLVRSFHTFSSRSYSTLFLLYKLFSVCYFALISFRAICLLYLLFFSFVHFLDSLISAFSQRLSEIDKRLCS